MGQFRDRSTVRKEEIVTISDWLQATVLKVHGCAGCDGPYSRCLDVDSKPNIYSRT